MKKSKFSEEQIAYALRQSGIAILIFKSRTVDERATDKTVLTAG